MGLGVVLSARQQLLPCSTHEVVILLLGLSEGHGSACGWCSCGEQTDPCPRNTSTETESNSLRSPFCELRAGSKREKKEPSFKRLELPGGLHLPLWEICWFVLMVCPGVLCRWFVLVVCGVGLSWSQPWGLLHRSSGSFGVVSNSSASLKQWSIQGGQVTAKCLPCFVVSSKGT